MQFLVTLGVILALLAALMLFLLLQAIADALHNLNDRVGKLETWIKDQGEDSADWWKEEK